MLHTSSMKTKTKTTQRPTKKLPNQLFVKIMGGQMSVMMKTGHEPALHLKDCKSNSCSCTLVVSSETIKSKKATNSNSKRQRNLSENEHKNPAVAIQIPCKKLKISMLYDDYETRHSFMAAFFKLLDDNVIQDFLWMDGCAKISDKYLLSMVYTYFRRAKLQRREFNRLNFFIALYLANDMEEDEEDDKYDIFPWALGKRWREYYPNFLVRRDIFWRKMDYRAVVSRQTCEEVMMIVPDHPIWERLRQPHHGGAWRDCSMSDIDPACSPRGPGSSPVICIKCRAPKSNSKDTPITTSDYSSQSPSDDRSSSLSCFEMECI